MKHTVAKIKSHIIEFMQDNLAKKLQVPPKGGVAVLPLDITAEAYARVKERERKLSEQKSESFEVRLYLLNLCIPMNLPVIPVKLML